MEEPQNLVFEAKLDSRIVGLKTVSSSNAILALTGAGTLTLLDGQTGKQKLSYESKITCYSLGICEQAGVVAIVGEGKLHFFDLTTLQSTGDAIVNEVEYQIRELSSAGNGLWVFVEDEVDRLSCWDQSQGSVLWTNQTGRVGTYDVAPRDRIVIASLTGSMNVIDSKTGNSIFEIFPDRINYQPFPKDGFDGALALDSDNEVIYFSSASKIMKIDFGANADRNTIMKQEP